MWKHPPSDRAVVAASKDDPPVFGLLFERHAPAVHAYLSRRAGRQTADDLLSEVFATAFDLRHRYDPDVGDAAPWLFGIARNTLLRRLRDDRRYLAAAGRVTVSRNGDPWEEVDDRLDAARPGAAARVALAQLPDAEREVLELVAWEDMTPSQAASALGVPPGTARSRLHRARRLLRQALADPPPPAPTTAAAAAANRPPADRPLPEGVLQ